ncbi:uncharacterized protein [Linepithema humile]|uniref:uncharacterized protein isoform X2 n=1 Tax=Linepithema humile TaxID=83485 RepID=UPI000623412B|nr:PREDICTED: uncharacterized protein LOC105677491 isoform X2 [Linepithema humile]
METFKNIDWHPTLEDLIDDVFIRDERMQDESAMYKILTDCFKDPFEDIESEYAEVDVEQIKQLSDDIDISVDMEEEKFKNKDSVQEEKSYVPGIRKLPFNFPRRSCLSKPQQAMCLRVLLKLSTKEYMLTDVQRAEMEAYMALQKQITKEQTEFLDFAKSKWDNNLTHMIKCNKYVIEKWKAKVRRLQQLPRYYIECKNIPLSVQEININTSTKKKIKVEFVTCLKQVSFFEVTLPKLDQPCKLSMNPENLLRKYQPCVVFDKATEHFRFPVSEDEYCEKFALETKADLIISSSGLKCLLNNLDYKHTNTWAIPVVIKSHNEKNFVYIDKKLPPLIATVPEKNTWVYKYILRYYFVDAKNKSLENAEKYKLDKSAVHLDSDDSECSYSSINHLKDYEKDLYLSDTDESEFASENEVPETHKNVSYKVFTIEPAEFVDQHDQVTHAVKKYRMLVRTKTEGIEVSSDGKSLPLILAPKMEHQLGFGAEATTLEEGIHQWASLMFTPEASLARVRIEADTSEVIQIERHMTTSLSSEMKRLYNVKVEDSLSILHNIIEVLSFLTPGRYILKHVPQNGSFAYVYKNVEESGKNVLDLHAIYQDAKFQTASITPWPLIDNMMTTPAIKCFNKMPAMFNAYSPKPVVSTRPRGRPKKKPTQESFSLDRSKNTR